MPNVPNNIVVYGVNSGIDRNDGTNGHGTPSAAGQIIVNYAGQITTANQIPTEELDDSPTFERAEQCTVVHHYRGNYNQGLNLLAIYGRGALITDSTGNFYRVLSTSLQYQKPGRCLLTITSESISFDVPPDEFSCTPVKLGLDILKHPRYFYALMPTNQIPNYTGTTDTNSQIAAKQAIIRAIQAYRENPFIPTTANINNMVGMLHDTIGSNIATGNFTVSVPNPNFKSQYPATTPDSVGTMYSGNPYPPAATGTGQANPSTYTVAVNSTSSDPNSHIAFAMAAAKELIGKLWRMEDSPPVSGLELTWTEYYFRPPPLNLGGYIEDPISNTTLALPDYFYSTAYPPNSSNTIFDGLSYYNPQCYSQNGQYGGGTKISWLRDADVLEYSRTWFRVTRKWLGAPVGSWDADIFSGMNRPTVSTYASPPPIGYRNLIMS